MNDQVGSRMERWLGREDADQGPAAAAGYGVPHSPASERAVIGWMLIDTQRNIAEAVMRFGAAGAEVFYDPRNRQIYQVLCGMQEAGKKIDVIPVFEAMERAGGLPLAEEDRRYILECMNLLRQGSPAGIEVYTARVWEKYLRREMLSVLAAAQGQVYTWTGETEALLDGIEAAVLAVSERNGSGQGARDMKSLVIETNELIEAIHRGVGIIGGIRTHFGYFDKMTGGLHRGELSVLAARPSVGKTSLMMNWAVNMASREKVPVGIFSLEMNAEDLALRARCAEAGVNLHKLRTGFATREDMARIMEPARAARISRWPIHIDATPGLGILEIRARARRLAQRHGVKVFMIDYTQLAHGLTGKEYRGNREREVADVSAGMKGMAKELDAAVLALSQLNRELERAKNRKPQLSDLRESGAIENDADLVGLLYRPRGTEEEQEDEEEKDEIRVNMEIAKQRNGPTGPVEMIFKKSLMQMEDAYQNRGMKLPEQNHGGTEAPSEEGQARGGELPSNEELGLGK